MSEVAPQPSKSMRLSHKPPRMAPEAKHRVIHILAEGCPCGSETATLRRRLIRNGNVCVHLQCDTCGASLSGSMKRAEHYFWQEYSEWNEALKEKSWEIRREQQNPAQYERDKAREARTKHYNEVFLRSPEWAAMREKVMRRADYICEACLTNPAEQVHHDHYAYGVAPPLFMLRAVCRECHERITFGWNKSRLSDFAVDEG